MKRFYYLGALILTSCSDPVPDQVEYDDVARMVGVTIATTDGGATLGAVDDSLVLAFGGMPAGFSYDGGMILGHHGTLDHRYLMVSCRDRVNAPLDPCNPLTATATLFAGWSGSLHQPGFDMRTSRQGMWTLSNLQTWMPTIIGSGQLQSTGTFGDRVYEMTASEGETMLVPTSMMGGTIHLDLAITYPNAPTTTAMDADVVFDAGMRSATLYLDGVHSYQVDLATGMIEK